MAALVAGAQNSSRASASKMLVSSGAEERTAEYLASVREKPLLLMGFLKRLPKGGDLHHHLTGAVYAESYINYAVADADCIDRTTFKILPPPCDQARGLLPASQAISDFVFRNLVIDALSIRNFHPTAEDRDVRLHFFATFGKFDLVTCFETLEHVPDPVASIGAIVDYVAEPGAVFYSTLTQPDDLNDKGMSWWYVGPRNGHISLFSKQALQVAWGRHGFKTVSFDAGHHLAFRTLPDAWRRTIAPG